MIFLPEMKWLHTAWPIMLKAVLSFSWGKSFGYTETKDVYTDGGTHIIVANP